MRIIFFVNHFFPDAGGVQWSALRSAEALAARGHRLTLVTETPAGDDRQDNGLPFEVIRFRVPRRRPLTRLWYWKWMWRHRALFRQADVLHFHDYTPFFHWFLPLRPFVRSPRYAVTFHGFEGWPLRLRHRIFRDVTARCCHARFAVGDYVRRYYRHPVDAVFVGAPAHGLRSISRTEEPAAFAFVGRLAEDTAILPVLTALASVSAELEVRAHVRRAGDGPLRPAIENLRSDTLAITLLGNVTDIGEVYAGASAVIATGFLGMFDGWSAGLPLIVPAFDALKSAYVASLRGAEDCMLRIDSQEEARRLFAALLRGRLDDRLDGLAQRGRMFVSQLRWNDIAELYEQWYRPSDPVRRRPASQWDIIDRRRSHTDAD